MLPSTWAGGRGPGTAKRLRSVEPRRPSLNAVPRGGGPQPVTPLDPRSPCLHAAVLRPVLGPRLPSCASSPRRKPRLGCSCLPQVSLELRGEAWSPPSTVPPRTVPSGGGSEALRLSGGLPLLQTPQRGGRQAAPVSPSAPQLTLLREVLARSGKWARPHLGFGREPSRDPLTWPALGEGPGLCGCRQQVSCPLKAKGSSGP